MGVQGDFLSRVLKSAGTPFSLDDYKDGVELANTNTAADNGRMDAAKARAQQDSPSRNGSHRGNRCYRPLRIGIDLSAWIHKASYGFGDILADHRHFTRYGRACLLEEQKQQESSELDPEIVSNYVTRCTRYVMERVLRLTKDRNIQLLAVLDGATPPAKMLVVQRRSQKRKAAEQDRDAKLKVEEDSNESLQKRIKANKRAGAGRYFPNLVQDLMEALRVNEIPFLVAPYEADSQLAWLSRQGLVDLIVTEDSDLVAQGAPAILYKVLDTISNTDNTPGDCSRRPHPHGTLLQRNQLGAGLVVDKRSPNPFSLVDFTDAMIAVMFVTAGCDYCTNLKGIGLLTACGIVREAFLEKPSPDLPPLEVVFRRIFDRRHHIKGELLSSEEKKAYQDRFLAALLMYRHPIIYNVLRQQCQIVGIVDHDNSTTTVSSNWDEAEGELLKYQPYKQLCHDVERRRLILGDLIDAPISTFVAEGWVNPRTHQPYENLDLPPMVKYLYNLPANDAIESDLEDDESFSQQQPSTQEEKVGQEENDNLIPEPAITIDDSSTGSAQKLPADTQNTVRRGAAASRRRRLTNNLSNSTTTTEAAPVAALHETQQQSITTMNPRKKIRLDHANNEKLQDRESPTPQSKNKGRKRKSPKGRAADPPPDRLSHNRAKTSTTTLPRPAEVSNSESTGEPEIIELLDSSDEEKDAVQYSRNSRTTPSRREVKNESQR